MATQYVGGGRRSVAPEYSPRAILGALALPGQSTVGQSPIVPQLMQSFTQAPAMQAPARGSEGLLSRSNAQNLGTLGNVSTIATNLGRLTETPSLSRIGGQAGQALSYVNFVDRLSRAKRPEDVALAVGSNPTVMSAMGVPGDIAGPIVGAISGYERDGAEGAVVGAAEGYMHAAYPITAAIDAALALTGNDSIFEFTGDVLQPVTNVVGDILTGVGDVAGDVASGIGEGVSDIGSSIGDIFGW